MAVEFSASTPTREETEDPTPIVPRCLTSADNADWGVSAAGGIGGRVSLSTPELSPNDEPGPGTVTGAGDESGLGISFDANSIAGNVVSPFEVTHEEPASASSVVWIVSVTTMFLPLYTQSCLVLRHSP